MRFSLVFSLKHEVLPLNINRVVVSFIKSALSEVNDGKLFAEYFENNKKKPYTFAVSLCKPVFQKDCITVGRLVCKVSFSFYDGEQNGYSFINALLAKRYKAYPLANQNEMMLKTVELEQEQIVKGEQMLVRTAVGGGICVRDHYDGNKDYYYSIADEDYEEQLQRCLRDELSSWGVEDSQVARVFIKCTEGKTVVAKHFGLTVPLTVGLFSLEGPNYLLQKIVDLGIGSRRSQGFGLINLIEEGGNHDF